MNLDDITSVDTSRKQRRRVGRGAGSGLGKTCGRGAKGEGSRTGGKNRGPLFEGGQFPFWMRLPKRGFTNFETKTVYKPIDLADALKKIKGGDITIEKLIEVGMAKADCKIKLVNGTSAKVGKGVKVNVHRVTGSVREAIQNAGGEVVEIDG